MHIVQYLNENHVPVPADPDYNDIEFNFSPIRIPKIHFCI